MKSAEVTICRASANMWKNILNFQIYTESEFSFENSKSEVIVQLADLISGTLSFI